MRKLKYNHPITSYPQDMHEDSAGILRLCKSCILVWKPFVVCADTHTHREIQNMSFRPHGCAVQA